MNHEVVSAIKRQIPFLIGGTITGIIMNYFLGFAVTIIVNSIMWYLISLIVYKLVWRKNGLTDQMVLLRYALTRRKRQKIFKEPRKPLKAH
jgi:p-aminobenzoyl-glutamate transporter AbgT